MFASSHFGNLFLSCCWNDLEQVLAIFLKDTFFKHASFAVTECWLNLSSVFICDSDLIQSILSFAARVESAIQLDS